MSRTYFTSVNTSNTVINVTNVTNVYNQRNVTNVTYVNRHVPGAVVAVPRTAFVEAQPVSRHEMRLGRDALVNAPVSSIAAVAPLPRSVRGSAAPGHRPPSQALDRRVVARTVPPPAPVPFAAKERLLAENPGRPLDRSAVGALRPATPASASNVQLVTPPRTNGRTDAPSAGRNAGGQRGQPAAAACAGRRCGAGSPAAAAARADADDDRPAGGRGRPGTGPGRAPGTLRTGCAGAGRVARREACAADTAPDGRCATGKRARARSIHATAPDRARADAAGGPRGASTRLPGAGSGRPPPARAAQCHADVRGTGAAAGAGTAGPPQHGSGASRRARAATRPRDGGTANAARSCRVAEPAIAATGCGSDRALAAAGTRDDRPARKGVKRRRLPAKQDKKGDDPKAADDAPLQRHR